MPEEEPFNYTPDPHADFKQVYTGFNGSEKSGAKLFDSESEVRSSGLVAALTPAQLQDVLKQIDFDRQVLLLYSVGKRENATGAVFVTDVYYDASLNFVSINGVVGVTKPDCTLPWKKSYPFALVAFKRPPKLPLMPSF